MPDYLKDVPFETLDPDNPGQRERLFTPGTTADELKDFKSWAQQYGDLGRDFDAAGNRNREREKIERAARKRRQQETQKQRKRREEQERQERERLRQERRAGKSETWLRMAEVQAKHWGKWEDDPPEEEEEDAEHPGGGYPYIKGDWRPREIYWTREQLKEHIAYIGGDNNWDLDEWDREYGTTDDMYRGLCARRESVAVPVAPPPVPKHTTPPKS